MAKGIREAAVEKFAANLPKFQKEDMTGTQFRASVIDHLVKKFDISVASAATHYNFALKETRRTNPEAVAGLGRPEGSKKGGRPPETTYTVVTARSGKVVQEGLSLGAAQELIKTAEARGKTALRFQTVDDLVAA
jgi:hypothetical protein